MRRYHDGAAAATPPHGAVEGPLTDDAGSNGPEADPALAEALAAAGRGWRVLPVRAGTKVPLIKDWPGKASDDPAVIHKWAGKWPGCNWGVLCGEASGIVVLDIDPRNRGDESLDAMEDEHGPLPDTVECHTGGGGRHFYFRHPGGSVKKVTDGRHGAGIDIIGDGGFVVLPGSSHQSGRRYEWEVSSHPDDVTLPALPDWHLTHAWDCNVVGGLGGIEAGPATPPPDPRDPLAMVAIHATLPTGPGQRNRCVFNFARRLKAVPHLADRRAVELRPLLIEWHRLALPAIRTKPIDETLADFAVAWGKVRQARGESMSAASALAAAAADPPALSGLGYGADTRFIARLCRELQNRRPDGPFMLACRALAGAATSAGFPMTHVTASGRLALLVADGVLDLATPAVKDPRNRRAAEYRYLLPD